MLEISRLVTLGLVTGRGQVVSFKCADDLLILDLGAGYQDCSLGKN